LEVKWENDLRYPSCLIDRCEPKRCLRIN
jgi:hypothetical protein